jgi:expansin
VALDADQFNQGGCGMCIELRGKGQGSGGDPVKGVYHVFVNNLCPECEYGHLDVAEPGDGLWDITWCVVCVCMCVSCVVWSCVGAL